MSILMNALDLRQPDYSMPTLADAAPQSKHSSDNYNGFRSAKPDTAILACCPLWPGGQEAWSFDVGKKAFKAVRGCLTEGRYLAFKKNGNALANADKTLQMFLVRKLRLGKIV